MSALDYTELSERQVEHDQHAQAEHGPDAREIDWDFFPGEICTTCFDAPCTC